MFELFNFIHKILEQEIHVFVPSVQITQLFRISAFY